MNNKFKPNLNFAKYDIVVKDIKLGIRCNNIVRNEFDYLIGLDELNAEQLNRMWFPSPKDWKKNRLNKLRYYCYLHNSFNFPPEDGCWKCENDWVDN
jgi:hypothetical protein